MNEFFGLYHLYEYQIIERDSDGTPVYRAGNNPYESSSSVPKADGAGLEEMRMNCEKMGMQVAQEKGGQWVGCSYNKEAEEEFVSFMENED